MRLSPKQNEIFEEMLHYVFNTTNTGYVLSGVAGSGKSTIIAEFNKILHQMGLYTRNLVYTGRAVSVLKEKSVPHAGTLHSALYEPIIEHVSLPNGKMTTKLIGFDELDADDVSGDVFIIDEAGMMPEKIFKLLLKLNRPLIFVGDKEQLPAIDYRETGFNIMDACNTHLDEIHRVAEGNPIIELSRELRDTGRINRKYVDNKTIFEVKSRDLIQYLNSAAVPIDIIMNGTNKKRHTMNSLYRSFRGYSEDQLYVGEQIMCTKNKFFDTGSSLSNGELFRVDKIRTESDDYWTIDLSNNFNAHSKMMLYKNQFLEHNCGEDEYYGDGIIQAVKGYAATVYKCQGSEFSCPAYLDEDVSYFSDQRKFRYTGVTRAKDKLVLID